MGLEGTWEVCSLFAARALVCSEVRLSGSRVRAIIKAARRECTRGYTVAAAVAALGSSAGARFCVRYSVVSRCRRLSKWSCN